MIIPRFIIRATIGVCATFFTAIAAEDLTEDQIDFFEKKIRPVLVNRCYNCHSADTKPSGGLRVDDRTGFFAGGDTGPAVVAGEPEKSLIIR
ncbi:MAG TPA: c-type cytochrome domain-containing protein, partial [Candidatus Kapabacteria bacterium]|nr:c-type cytochrome domain-containing protein [Candidatus Kapabacteria bacterium]